MYVVDRLRKFERLTAEKCGRESRTFEAVSGTILKRKEDNQMEQREWLKMQRRLVDVCNEKIHCASAATSSFCGKQQGSF